MSYNILNRHISEFIPIGICFNEIKEEVYWGAKNITERIILISLEPILYGIWYSGEIPLGKSFITFKCKADTIIKMRGVVKEKITVNTKTLVIWEPETTEMNKITFYEKVFELPQMLKQSTKSKFKFNYSGLKHIAACYFYPRKVYVVVVKTVDFLNIFPMDLHLPHPLSQDYLFALQPSNVSIKHIKNNNKIVVCEIPSKHLKYAYELEKNHGQINLVDTKLPFNYALSKNFDFPIPDFSVGYKEIVVKTSHNLNSHTLFLGTVLYEEKVPFGVKQPFHIHRFHFRYCLDKNIIDKSKKLNIA